MPKISTRNKANAQKEIEIAGLKYIKFLKTAVFILVILNLCAATWLIYIAFDKDDGDYFYADSTYSSRPINWTERELQREECNKPYWDYLKNSTGFCNMTDIIGNCYLMKLESDVIKQTRDLCLMRYNLY